MTIQIEEIPEYVLQQTKILTEINDLENASLTTIKSKIKRLREVTKPLVEAGHYPDKNLGHLCSIIRDKLIPYNLAFIENRSGWFYDLFEEGERERTSAKMAQTISSLPLEKQTGIDEIDKLKQASRNSEPLPDDYINGIYFRKIIEVDNERIKQCESLIRKLEAAFYFTKKFDKQYPDKKQLETTLSNTGGKKQKEITILYNLYRASENIIQNIEEGVGAPNKNIESLNEILSDSKFVSKQIDERSKITFLEKWNSIIAQIDIGISAIAKKLGVNKKHLTNNVRPRENPVTGSKNMHHNHIEWFRSLTIITPKGERFTFDAKDYFDKQIERGKLNVPFQQMILRNCELE